MKSRRDEYGDYPDDDYTDPYARRDRDMKERGKASRVDAEHRTLESFNERKERDPTARRQASSPASGDDNVDHEWDRMTRDRTDRSMYDSREQLGDDGDEEDEGYDLGSERDKRASRNKDANWRTDVKNTRPRGQDADSLNEVDSVGGKSGGYVFTDMSWRDEERALGPRHNNRDWRNYVRNDRADELYKKDDKPKLRRSITADNEAQKRKAERDWKKTKGKPDVEVHVVCVDETPDAERAFKFAARHLPSEHRLVLTHGLYEGLLGHNRSDELRLRRVGNKYMQACSELGVRSYNLASCHHVVSLCSHTMIVGCDGVRHQRECTFRHFHYTSSGNFGEEVCDLAQRAHAKVRAMAVPLHSLAS
jgi:hypothetical protein